MATDNSSKLQTISDAKRALNDGQPTRDAFEGKKGSSTHSGTGATTGPFNILHGLGQVPSQIILTATSVAAGAVHSATKDGTNISVTFAAAPANAANNITFDWVALY